MPFLRRWMMLSIVLSAASAAVARELPQPSEILAPLRRVNDRFMQVWSDPGREIKANGKIYPSNIWTRAVYYEGLMALHRADSDSRYLDYALRWGEFHQWGLRRGATTRNADNQCCGQTYLELYRYDPKPERIHDLKTSIDAMLASEKIDDWTWIDAIQMAMPVFARFGMMTGDRRYYDRMHEMYLDCRDRQGGKGLFNPADGLWWRDRDFVPPYAEPNGEDCYWSRGNGWVIAAMVRVLEALPADVTYRAEYVQMLRTMAKALKAVQRDDGFWNVSLHDPTHFGGPESTGTALFTYAIAWGVRAGHLPADEYLPVVAKAWTALSGAVLEDGRLGYIQSTGKEPKDGQPVRRDTVPDFEDFAVGCFLLAGSEVAQLAEGNATKAP
ncbi:MAG TPA: glycoside hydrolase family 88 protein [Opitutaceae bacterium]